jgi:hypothetical protein
VVLDDRRDVDTAKIEFARRRSRRSRRSRRRRT